MYIWAGVLLDEEGRWIPFLVKIRWIIMRPVAVSSWMLVSALCSSFSRPCRMNALVTLPCTDQGTEAYRLQVIFLQSHNRQGAEPELELGLSGSSHSPKMINWNRNKTIWGDELRCRKRRIHRVKIIRNCVLRRSFFSEKGEKVCLDIFLFFYSFFLGPHPPHMEVPRLGAESELPLPAHTTATARWDPSHICNLHNSSTAHGNTGSLTHWARPGMEPASSWMLVGFIIVEPQGELLFISFKSSDALLKIYGNSRQAADPQGFTGLELGSGFRISSSLFSLFPVWGIGIVSYMNLDEVWCNLRWLTCPHWVITGMCDVKSWWFSFCPLDRNNFLLFFFFFFFFFLQASISEFLLKLLH